MSSFSAYVTVDEDTLYIQGGSNVSTSAIAYNQFFSLDLTQSWNTSSPPWSEVPIAAGSRIPTRLRTVFHSISLSRDHKTLTFWDVYYSPPYSVNYHLDTNKWEELPALPLQRPLVSKVSKAATDPSSDQVYIPGGAGSSMLSFDPFSSISSVLAMPPGGRATSWNAASFVWNNVRQTFLLFGGFDTPGSAYFYEYKPSSATPWTVLSSGSEPPALAGGCMVSAYNGAKMVVFGGRSGGTISGALYILDVASMTWSEGLSSQPRTGMVCSVSGDYFIAWGGVSSDTSDESVLLPDTPIVYSLNSGQWTTMFVAKNGTSVPPPLTPAPTPTKSPVTGEPGAGTTVTDAPITTATDAPTDAPIASPTDVPIATPTDTPITTPTDAPITAPTDAPIITPTDAPIITPTDAPIATPTDAPITTPTDAPITTSTVAPTDVPITTPTDASITTPTDAPITIPTDATTPTEAPITTVAPTDAPISTATDAPITTPTDAPITTPTDASITTSTDAPITTPIDAPITTLTVAPTDGSSTTPTDTPIPTPTVAPTEAPITTPTEALGTTVTGAPGDGNTATGAPDATATESPGDGSTMTSASGDGRTVTGVPGATVTNAPGDGSSATGAPGSTVTGAPGDGSTATGTPGGGSSETGMPGSGTHSTGGGNSETGGHTKPTGSGSSGSGVHGTPTGGGSRGTGVADSVTGAEPTLKDSSATLGGAIGAAVLVFLTLIIAAVVWSRSRSEKKKKQEIQETPVQMPRPLQKIKHKLMERIPF
ncbi:hypothetical protein BGZ47_010567 [Haplosporangium gracile]|nr:hypothetical protein BGZ47_010567 [Haplosporangium gracile]